MRPHLLLVSLAHRLPSCNWPNALYSFPPQASGYPCILLLLPTFKGSAGVPRPGKLLEPPCSRWSLRRWAECARLGWGSLRHHQQGYSGRGWDRSEEERCPKEVSFVRGPCAERGPSWGVARSSSKKKIYIKHWFVCFWAVESYLGPPVGQVALLQRGCRERPYIQHPAHQEDPGARKQRRGSPEYLPPACTCQ